jgi:hypothetical protein
MSADRSIPYVVGITFNIVVVVIVIVVAISFFLKRCRKRNPKPDNRSSFYARESVLAYASDKDIDSLTRGSAPTSRLPFGTLPPQTLASLAPLGATHVHRRNALALPDGRSLVRKSTRDGQGRPRDALHDIPRVPSLRTAAAEVVGSLPHDSVPADSPAVSMTAQSEGAYIEYIQNMLAPVFGPAGGNEQVQEPSYQNDTEAPTRQPTDGSFQRPQWNRI